MRRFSNIFIGIVVLFLLSCSNTFSKDSDSTSISITLPFQGREAWLKGDITSYNVILTFEEDLDNPQKLTATPENPTVKFQELEPGTYQINVFAYNGETEIAAGQTKVTVEEGQNATANVRMTLYQTKGGAGNTVTVTLNSNYENGPAPVQWKDISKPIPTYNSIFTNDNNFTYGSREDKIDNKNYCFCGWSVGAPAKEPYTDYTILQMQDLYSFTEDTTLYAVWCEQNKFESNESNFVISYKLSPEYKYNVYFLNSHRNKINLANPKLLFPELTLPASILAPSWKASEGNELGNASLGQEFEDVTITGTAEFTYTFSSISFAITLWGDTSKNHGFHNVEITDFSNCDYIDGSFCYLLPREWDDFDNSLTKPENCTFAGWSIGGDIVTYINLNNANDLTEVFSSWKESEFLSTKYDIFYTISNLGDKQSDGTSEYFDFSISNLDLGQLKYVYDEEDNTTSKMMLQKEQSTYIPDDEIYELWYELYLENGGYPSDKFNDIRIDYVTNNGIICTASIDGRHRFFYLATQAQYEAVIIAQKLYIISEKPISTAQIDEAINAYNVANP